VFVDSRLFHRDLRRLAGTFEPGKAGSTLTWRGAVNRRYSG
jgi:hypothetical protein